MGLMFFFTVFHYSIMLKFEEITILSDHKTAV